LAEASANSDSMEYLMDSMDSIWINLGKVKTLEYVPEAGSVPTTSDFALVENKINTAFPVRWHGHCLRDITLPENFELTASRN